MRQLQELGQLIDKGEGSSRYLGIIYMSWEIPTANQRSSVVSFQQQWRTFVECEVEALFANSVFYAGKEWIGGDFFIQISLPEGHPSFLEGWLLEFANMHTEEWEQKFIQNVKDEDRLLEEGLLHVGAAVVKADAARGEELGWYKVMKKAMLHGQTAGAMKRSLKRRSLEHIIRKKLILPVYQPIVSLRKQGEIFGYESLMRTENREWFQGPLELFQFAEQEGLTYALDRLAREKAIDGCIPLKEEQKLFINVMAQIMEDPSFSPGQTLSLLEQHQMSPHKVVFEITERSSIADFGSMKRVLEHYRSQGYQIAIDDVGAGYSSLQSIIELRPDYLKVDRSIIQNIDLDVMKEHILHTLIELAAKMNIPIIAEGIEREEELAKVREMGIDYAQGYLLGRPAAFI